MKNHQLDVVDEQDVQVKRCTVAPKLTRVSLPQQIEALIRAALHCSFYTRWWHCVVTSDMTQLAPATFHTAINIAYRISVCSYICQIKVHDTLRQCLIQCSMYTILYSLCR